MVRRAASDSTDEPEKISSQDNEEQQYVLQVGWKKHLPIFTGAMLSALVAAATLPIFAVIYGLVFRDYTDYSAGKLDSNALRSSVTRYCLILTGIASVNWMANSIYFFFFFFFFFFLTFGELQARSARNRIFDALMSKDMAWYDTRETGTAALLPAIQM
jgi:ATP-binding cassette subfamily B (MDR/TAP) protein 1